MFVVLQAAVDYALYQDFPSPDRPPIETAYQRMQSPIDLSSFDVIAQLSRSAGRIGNFAEVAAQLVPVGNGGGNMLYPFKEGVERYFISDINNPAAAARSLSSLPLLFDRFDPGLGPEKRRVRVNHMPGGANVLYMDGHVAFLKYPSANPADVPCTKLCAYVGSIW